MIQGSLIYHHSREKQDPPRLLTHLTAVAIAPCDAPAGRGIAIVAKSFRYAVAVEGDRGLLEAWLQCLTEARAMPTVSLPENPLEQASSSKLSSLGRVKSALASAFATSRLGRHLVCPLRPSFDPFPPPPPFFVLFRFLLAPSSPQPVLTRCAHGGGEQIKRYLDEAAKVLIRTVVEFVEVQNGPEAASKIEGYVFDVAARIAVIVHSNAIPPGLDIPALNDQTMDFCMLFLRYARDRRLAEERRRAGNAKISELDTNQLLEAINYVAAVWRSILSPNVSRRVIARYDHIITLLFSDAQLRAILDDLRHRERMVVIERSLRTLVESY